MNRLGFRVIGYRTGGTIALVIGVAHFFLPTWGYDGALLETVPEAPRDHFVYLGTYAIGMFLLIAGIMSIHLAGVAATSTATLFALLQTAFWADRFILEVSFPSRLRIFFLSEPATALMLVSAIACVSYAVAFWASQREQRNAGDAL
jgi:Mn2+/Fe2+ NRAMP family transporter